MTLFRKISFIALSSLAVILSLRYAFYQPYQPNAVLKAVPADSPFFYPADNLDALMKSPVRSQIDRTFENGNSLESLLNTAWVKRTTPANMVVTGLPLYRAGSNRVWAVSSWIGWRSPWLRWRLEQTRIEGLTRLDQCNIWPIWSYKSDQFPDGTTLVFSLTDQILIACLTDHPSDIHWMLEAYDKRIPSVHNTL